VFKVYKFQICLFTPSRRLSIGIRARYFIRAYNAKKEIVTGGDKPTSHGKAPSGESGNKMKGSPSHNKLHRSSEKKRKM
jgi:hypothetical protein